jgi:hypothetical protein
MTMEIGEALRYVNDTLVTWPGWQVRAEDYSHRYQDTICLHITLTDARSTDRAAFPSYTTPAPPGAGATRWPIHVGGLAGTTELAYQVTLRAVRVFEHEWREFLRQRPDGTAPLHPHRSAGIASWADLSGTDASVDYGYGLA